MTDFHRGDIYEIVIERNSIFPFGDRRKVLILQNDAGEIPCMVVNAVSIEPRACWYREGKTVNTAWRLRDHCPHRYSKRSLGRYLGTIDRDDMDAIVEEIEEALGVEIPEILEAP